MRFLSAGNNSQDFPVVPSGPHLAICYGVVDLGTHEKNYQGQTKSERQIRVIWEIPGEKMDDGRPMAISKTYKASLHEKARLRADIKAWRNKDLSAAEIDSFDISMLIGKPVMLSVTHTDKEGGGVYANVGSLMPPIKGTPIPAMHNAPLFFSLDEFDPEVYERLSKGAREKIAKSPEYAKAVSRKPVVAGAEDEDVPF